MFRKGIFKDFKWILKNVELRMLEMFVIVLMSLIKVVILSVF